MVEIERARVEDAAAMARIARSLLLEGRDLNVAQERGFFLFAGREEFYAQMIRCSRYCYVARDSPTCIGFLTTREPDQLRAMKPSKYRDIFLEHGEFPLLIDQLGVLPSYQGRGVGQALLDQLLADCPAPRITATVVVGPVRNARSIRFFAEQNHWTLRKQVNTGDHVWSFFELRR
ncbi:MAG: GNAT family N-acetyltransferase [Bryobacteraceae bacterium]|nr:GNAT family N-acetyltransferase [Bryobacteraceae bacterium]MDW8378877.1 GNAT family N-acetyltransferase [Bryobacterales bacterium]